MIPSTTETEKKLTQFLASTPAGIPVVLITSGGTSVPLEKNTVRYLSPSLT